MEFELMSDVHLEFRGGTYPPLFQREPTAPFLALLGDIGCCNERTVSFVNQKTNYEALFSFLQQACARYTVVFFVAVERLQTDECEGRPAEGICNSRLSRRSQPLSVSKGRGRTTRVEEQYQRHLVRCCRDTRNVSAVDATGRGVGVRGSARHCDGARCAVIVPGARENSGTSTRWGRLSCSKRCDPHHCVRSIQVGARVDRRACGHWKSRPEPRNAICDRHFADA